VDETEQTDILFEKIALDLGFITEKRLNEAKKFQKDLVTMEMPSLPMKTICLKKKLLSEAQVGQIERAIKELEADNVIPGYQIIAHIARGAMGTVYKAFQVAMERSVCLKILDPDLAEEPRWVKKFMNQGKVLARLSHHHICDGYDAGHLGDRYFVAVEYIPGLNLKELLEVQIRLEEPEAIKIIEQITKALEHASSKGIVHRDIKPQSIIVTNDGTAKLCDYGLALEDEEIGEDSPPGNPFYISPEQAKGFTEIDVRSDIYSLGATFFHLITGQVPFGGEDPFEVMTKHIMEPPATAREANSEISEATSELITRMMAKEPDERFQSPTALLHAIQDAKVNRLMEEEPPVEVVAPPDFDIEEDLAPGAEDVPVIRRRRRGKKRPRSKTWRKPLPTPSSLGKAVPDDLVGQADLKEPGYPSHEAALGADGAPVDIPDDVDLDEMKPLTAEDKADAARVDEEEDLEPTRQVAPSRRRSDRLRPAGSKRGTVPVYAEEPEPFAPEKSHKALIISLIVILLIGAGIVVLSLNISRPEYEDDDEYAAGTATSTGRRTGTAGTGRRTGTGTAARQTPTATGTGTIAAVWDWKVELKEIKAFAEKEPDKESETLRRYKNLIAKTNVRSMTEAAKAVAKSRDTYATSRWGVVSRFAQELYRKEQLRAAFNMYNGFQVVFKDFSELKQSAEAQAANIRRGSSRRWQSINREIEGLVRVGKFSIAREKLKTAQKNLLSAEANAARDALDEIKKARLAKMEAALQNAEQEFLTLKTAIQVKLANSELEPAKKTVIAAIKKSEYPLFKNLADDFLTDINRIIEAKEAIESGIKKSIGSRFSFFFPDGSFKVGKVISYEQDTIRINTHNRIEIVLFKQLSGHTILQLALRVHDKEKPDIYSKIGLYSLYVRRDNKHALEMFEKAEEKGAPSIARFRNLIRELEFADMIVKGESFYRRGKYMEAVEEFTRVLDVLSGAGQEGRRKLLEARLKDALEKSGITKILTGSVTFRDGRYVIVYDFSRGLQLADFVEYVWSQKKKGEPSWEVKNGRLVAKGKKMMRWRSSFDQRTNFKVEFQAEVVDSGAGFEILVAADNRGFKGKCYLVGFGASVKSGEPREIYFAKLGRKKITKLGAESTPTIVSGQRYNVKISYTEGFYRIYVDESKVLEIAEKAYTGGTIVFRAVGGTVFFDNIILTGKIDPDWLKNAPR